MALETSLAFILADELDAEDSFSCIRKGAPSKKRKHSVNRNLRVERLPATEFTDHFQLTATQVEELTILLKPCWHSKHKGWTIRNAVLASLWTLSTQESYSDVAGRFHSTESVIIDQLDEFCTLLAQNLADQICWPQGDEADKSVVGFCSVTGIPHTLCVVGSCHIPIEKPIDVLDPEEYRNAGNFYSVNLLTFCDHAGYFTYISAEHPGSWHNSRVLLATEVGKALLEDPLALLDGKHILGDTTFPLSEHLLTPYFDCGNLERKKEFYNLRVKAALTVVQTSLCGLNSRFQRLKSLQYHSVSKTSMAVRACCILHRMCPGTHNIINPDEAIDNGPVKQEPFHALPGGHFGSLGGISRRQEIAALLWRGSKCLHV